MSWGGSTERTRRQGIDRPVEGYFAFGHAADFDAATVRAFQDMGLPVIVSINLFHYEGAGDAVALGNADVRRILQFGVKGLQIDTDFEEAARLEFERR